MNPKEREAREWGAAEYSDWMHEDPEWESSGEDEDALEFFLWMQEDLEDLQETGGEVWSEEAIGLMEAFFEYAKREGFYG